MDNYGCWHNVGKGCADETEVSIGHQYNSNSGLTKIEKGNFCFWKKTEKIDISSIVV